MNFPHLQGRERLLGPLGFTPQQAEWITLVCLHSGIFTRDQAQAFLGTSRTTARRFFHALLDARVSGRPVTAAAVTDGRHVCRIFGKAVYRSLGIANVRHRRDSSIEVTRRRLLSLDFVLDHPELPWLPTEPEKVACFRQLGIDAELLPKRIYYGRANGRVRYFHIKMPIAVERDRAVFTYIDPGMGTPTELQSWGAAHWPLWEKLRESARRVEVVAVAWEQHLLDRAERILQSWTAGAMSEAGTELLALRQAVAEADWDTVERYGGLNAALRKMNELARECPVSNGRGMIDDCHLWGSRRCRRKGGPFTQGGWAT